MAKEYISLEGVRTHNLKDISLRIPKNCLVVVTGVSGSGKSSLIFDTVFKYAKSVYLGALGNNRDSDESDFQVDQISGIQPPVALEQSTRRLSNPRSTIGTLIGIDRSLRVLFARFGTPVCPVCQMATNIHLQCSECGCYAMPLTPQHFSANQKDGMCLECNGMGRVSSFSEDKVVPDQSRTLKWIWDNAEPGTYSIPNVRKVFEAMCNDKGIPLDRPYAQLSQIQRDLVMHGCAGTYFISVGKVSNNMRFDGILGYLDKQYRNTSSASRRCSLERYLGESHCAGCGGGRLRSESLAVRIHGYNISDLLQMSIQQLSEVLLQILHDPNLSSATADVVRSCMKLCNNICNVGLPYLTLSRQVASLSGGELQRILLAQHVVSDLTGVMYVLDEPSIGLHERDTRKLLSVLTQLRDLGNSVIVIEHDETIIRAADWIVEIGPGAGQQGGEVTFEGNFAQLLECNTSITAHSLMQRPSRSVPHSLIDVVWFHSGITKNNNLKSVQASLPLNALTCITGVSGAGKSSLVRSIYEEVMHAIAASQSSTRKNSKSSQILFDEVVYVEQKPIGRSTRSTVATYLGISDDIRDIFAALPESEEAGLGRSHFSTNVTGGRCETCKGLGEIEVDMYFLKSDYVQCTECNGHQFQPHVLDILWEGKNIHDVLQLSVEEAIRIFASYRTPQSERISKALKLLEEFGLGYLKLGQSTTTLSGGEAQRVNLSAELANKKSGRTLYIFDEPTRGLHLADLAHLMRLFDLLLSQDQTVLIIEHNLDVIARSDHVIDVGPEGGNLGGKIIFSGDIEGLMSCPESYTGRYLAEHLQQRFDTINTEHHDQYAKNEKISSLPPSISLLPLSTCTHMSDTTSSDRNWTFPSPDQFEHAWVRVMQLADSVRDSDCASIMADFLGDEPRQEFLSRLRGVHHVAIYLGDYSDDSQVFAWIKFLDKLGEQGQIHHVEFGPSYISPKQYGTPGWWVSLQRKDGFVIEIFCCRAFGPWLKRSRSQRTRLMSHAALTVTERVEVQSIMQSLIENYDQLEQIAYIEGDELGHCYGHLRNNVNHTVIELIHSQQQECAHV